jgi:hypothetical protein
LIDIKILKNLAYNIGGFQRVNDILDKLLIACDEPEFDDCIRMDKDCFEAARQLAKKNRLSANKQRLLLEQVKKTVMVKMYGWRWWKERKK